MAVELGSRMLDLEFTDLGSNLTFSSSLNRPTSPLSLALGHLISKMGRIMLV
jgi:hypothetical protein